MTEYQKPSDLRYGVELAKGAPAEAKAFLAFDHAAKRSDGHLSTKTRELVSLAVALTTQCAYCLDVHTRAAKEAGVSAEELAEVIAVAAAVRAGATMAHGTFAMRMFLEEAERPKEPNRQ